LPVDAGRKAARIVIHCMLDPSVDARFPVAPLLAQSSSKLKDRPAVQREVIPLGVDAVVDAEVHTPRIRRAPSVTVVTPEPVAVVLVSEFPVAATSRGVSTSTPLYLFIPPARWLALALYVNV
jgi:hypothetical protein